jgi:hypothetical protein
MKGAIIMLRQCRDCAMCVRIEGYTTVGECHRHSPQVVLDANSWDRFPRVKLSELGCMEFVPVTVGMFEKSVEKHSTPEAKDESRVIDESMKVYSKLDSSITSKPKIVKSVTDKTITSSVKPVEKKSVNKPVIKSSSRSR